MFEIIPSFDIFTVLTFSLVLLLTYMVWNNFNQRVNIPGPWQWPFLGNVPSLIGTKNITDTFMKLRGRYGNLVYLKLQGQFVIVYGYKLVKEILVENAGKTKFRPSGGRIVKEACPDGPGVALSNGEDWSHMRKFTIVALKDFGVGKKSIEEKIDEEVDYLVDLFTKQKEQPLSISGIFQKATSNIISSIIFGSRFDYNDPDFLAILANVDYIFKNSASFSPGSAFPIFDKLNPYSKIRKAVKCRTQTTNYILSRIEDQRKTFDPKNIRNFLDLFLAQEGKSSNISESRLVATITDLYFAGTDTTALTLQWSMLYMLKYPYVQKKCQNEITEFVGDRRPHAKDKDRLPYVLATLHEIQRIATIVPVGVPHYAIEDVHVDGKVIPKGSIIICCLYSVNHDPKMWENPEEFHPERFIDGNGQFLKQEAFSSFSMGPRVCLGKQLAETEAFLFFTSFLQMFHLRKADDNDELSTFGVQTGTTFQPQPFKMRFISRS